MKIVTLTSLLQLATTIAFAQKIDWINAPINPIALEYKLEHFNLKGDVYGYGPHTFSKDGMLLYENSISAKHYLYKNGQLYADTHGQTYKYNSQGYIAEYTFASMGAHTYTFNYNTNGLLTKKSASTGYNIIYEYDAHNRLIKENSSGKVKEYSYQKNGDQLIITEKDLSKTPIATKTYIYKNGVRIGSGETLYSLTIDTKGNMISQYGKKPIYYSDIAKANNEVTMVYTKPTYTSTDKTMDCRFYINGIAVGFIFKKSIERKHLLVYHPFAEKYYIIEDAFNDAKSGVKQTLSKVFINSPYYLDLSERFYQLGYKGSLMQNSGYLRSQALPLYKQSENYIIYDKFIDKNFYTKYDTTQKELYLPLKEGSPNTTTDKIQKTNTSAPTQTNTPIITPPTPNIVPYNSLSEEAKTYIKMYTEKAGDLKRKQYLQKLHDDWAKKGVSTSSIVQLYANIVTEIYSKDTNIAFNMVIELPFDVRARDVMNKLKPEIQNTIRTKAQATVAEFDKTRTNNATTTPITALSTTVMVQPIQTAQKPEPEANPLTAYIGKVYQLDIANPHGNSAYDKPQFYIFGYEGQKLKGIVQYENGKLRTKTTVTINAPYYYEYASFPEYLIKNKKIVGTCSKNIAICNTCGGNGNSSKTKETKKTTGYNYMNNTVTEVTYRTYYSCGRCSGKGLLPNG